jgi:ABC-type phosphate/phosphonate transport system permease subunit
MPQATKPDMMPVQTMPDLEDMPYEPNLYTWLWLGILVAFLGLELWALHRPSKGDTFSEFMWWVFSRGSWGRFLTWMVSFFMVWSIIHFISRGKWA